MAMNFTIMLKQQPFLGRMPILDADDQPVFVLRGSIADPGQTIYLTDANRKETGRLFPATKEKSRKQIFTIDVVGQPLVTVSKLPGQAVSLFYMSHFKYWVYGNAASQVYSFKKGLATEAEITKTVQPGGPVARCWIKEKSAVPAVLLASALVSSWNLKELTLPDLFPNKLSLDDC